MSATMLVSTTRISERFDRIGPNVHAALLKAIGPLAAAMESDAKSRAAAHIRFLGGKPGQYLKSIKGGVSEKDQRITGYLRSGSPIAHLLEFGAKTPPHEILPKVAQILAFEGDAGTVFARAVHSPGATIPPYPAIYPAFEALSGEIKGALTEAAQQAARDS